MRGRLDRGADRSGALGTAALPAGRDAAQYRAKAVRAAKPVVAGARAPTTRSCVWPRRALPGAGEHPSVGVTSTPAPESARACVTYVEVRGQPPTH